MAEIVGSDLKRISLLSDLSEAEQADVATCMERKVCKAREVLVHVDDPVDDVYFVLAGLLRVSIVSEDGREVIYREFLPGDVIGDMAAIDGGERSADVVALSDSSLAAMTRKDFTELLSTHPLVAMAELKRLTAGMRDLTTRVFEILTQAAEDRLKAELIRLADDHNIIEVLPNQTEIAGRIGSHREAISRMLNGFERKGWIRREGRTLTIEDPDILLKP